MLSNVVHLSSASAVAGTTEQCWRKREQNIKTSARFASASPRVFDLNEFRCENKIN